MFDLASLNEHDRCPEQKVLRTVLKSNPMNASPSSDMEQPDDESTKVNLISQVVNKSSGLNDTKEAVLVPTSGHSHPVTVDEVDVSNGSQSQIGYMMCVNETELKLGGYRETTSTQLTPCSSPASRHHEPDGRLMSQAPLHIVASALNLGEGLEPTTIEPYCSVRSLASSSKGRTLSCLEAIGKLSRSVMVEKWEDQKVSSGFATNFPHFTKSNSTKLDPTITWRLQGSILAPSSGSLMPDFTRQISTGLASRRPSLQQSEAGGTANSESLVYSVLPPFLSSVQLSGPEEVITCSTDRPGFSSLSVDAMNLIAAKQAEPPTTDLDPGVTVGLELGTDEKSTSGRLMTAWQSMRELYAEGAGDPTEQIRRKRDQGVTDLLNLDDRHMATSIVAVSLAEGLQGLQGGSGDQTTGLLETSDMEWAHSTAVYAGDEGGRCWPTPLRRHRLRTAISLDSILLAQEESQTRRGFLKGKDTNKLTNDVCLIATQSEQTIPIRLYAESFGATLALQLKHSLNRQNSESIKSNLAVSLEGNRGATTLCSIIYESPSVQHSPFALEVTAWPGRCVQAELTKTYSDGNITKIVDRCENVEDVSKASSRSDLVNLGCPACTEERMKETLGRLRGQADSLSSLSSPPQTGAYVYTGSPSDANSECSCYHQLNEADIENGPNRVVPMDEVQPKGETQESGKLGQIGKMGKLGKLSKLNKSGIFGKFAQSVSEAKKMEVGLKVMHSLADTENLPARDKFATNKSAACEDSPILGFSQSVFPEKRCSPKSRKSVEQIVQLLAVQETRSVFQEWLVEQVAKTISRQNRHQSGPQTISNDAVGDCATESSCASTCCSLGNQPARRLVRGQKQYFPKTLPTSFDSGSDCCPGLGSGCGSVLASTSASVCCSDCDSGTGSEPSTPAIFTANYAGQKAKLNYPIDDISYDETVVNNCPRCLAEGEHQKVGPGMKVHHKQTFAEETGLWKPIVQEEDEFSDETILVAESLASESLEEECTSCESDEEALGNLQETIKNSGQQTHEPKWPHLKRKSAEKEDTTKCRSLYLKNRQKKIKGQTKTNGMWTREHENRIIKGSIKVRTAINGVSSLDEPHMAANAHKKEAAMKEVTHIYPSSQIPRLQNLGENNRESFKKSQIDKKLENQRLVASGKAEVWRETVSFSIT
ncbi:unnamed protein product [Protopolystoma xenopodis]|uniref:Uncharacterized protein n=1 Tax=Protopolystoma xenopodis TaxID=117903 RepID=A0A3S4ZPE8_9PLAT|nr:unnamed protein product [Protopolystoma xenopodis]